MADIQYDYSKLLGRMREKGFTQVNLAHAIGVSETTLNLSLANKRSFKQNEMLAICFYLGIEVANVDDYFFCHKTLEI